MRLWKGWQKEWVAASPRPARGSERATASPAPAVFALERLNFDQAAGE
jgi:hypothetical protein